MSNDLDRPRQSTTAIGPVPPPLPQGASVDTARGRTSVPCERPLAAADPPIRPAHRAHSAAPATSRTRAWLILPMGIAGVIVAVIIGSLMQREPPQTVSEVMRQVSETVLRTSDRPGVEDGGPLGPLWIAARQADVKSGELTDVRLHAGQVRVAATNGRVIIDPNDNTISFALENVILLRVPDAGKDANAGQSLMELDSFVLGPLNYKRRIVPDGTPVNGRRAQDRLAGVPME